MKPATPKMVEYMKTNLLIPLLILVLPHIAFSKNIAVLPFTNVTSDESKNWIGLGFSETLTTKLANIKSVTLIERSQLSPILQELKFQMSGFVDEKQAVQVGKIHSVDVLVLGSFQIMSDMLRVSARFVSVETGEVINTTETDGNLKDIFKLQDTIAFNLISNLNIKLAGDEKQKVSVNPTKNITAYELYMKGMQASKANGYVPNDLAIEYLTKAIEGDKSFVDAYLALVHGYDAKGMFNEAVAHATKAWELKPNDETRRTLAYEYYQRGGHFLEKGFHDKAIADFTQAIELTPKTKTVREQIDASKTIKTITRTSTSLEVYYGNRAIAYLKKGMYDKAIADYTKTIELYPEDKMSLSYAYIDRADIYYFDKGECDEAIKDYSKVIELNQSTSHLQAAYFNRGLCFYKKGLKEKTISDWKESSKLGLPDAKDALKKYFNIDY